MHGKPFEVDAEELLAESRWVKRLARKLVRDATAADDVVQETWLAALRARRDSDAPLRPWLARVVANFARERRRGDLHRSERELASVRGGHAPSAAETAERIESQRLLLDALAAVPEPYRTVVTRRYLDGQSSARIARALDVPEGTVRWRLARGLELVRAELDARGGRRGTWCIAFLPLLHGPSLVPIGVGASGVGSTIHGAVTMKVTTKVALAAAILLTASIGMWVALDAPRTNDDVAARSKTEEIAPPVDRPVDRPPKGPIESQTLVAEAERARSSVPKATASSSETSSTPRTRVEARFLDERDHPIEGVELVVKELEALAPAKSDAEGRLALEVRAPPRPFTYELEARRNGYATHFDRVLLEEAATAHLGDVHLSVGGSVAGRVLDADGLPAADVDVVVTAAERIAMEQQAHAWGPTRYRAPSAKSAADGTFRVEGVRAGSARAWAGDDRSRWSYTVPIEVPAGSVVAGIELRIASLESEDTIDGVVLGPENEPIPDVQVKYVAHSDNGSWSGDLRTGKDGRFRHRVPVRGSHRFVAHDEKERWPDAVARDVQPGTHDVELRFASPRFVTIDVRDRQGKHVEEFATTILNANRSLVLRAEKVETHADGRVRLLVPSETFQIDVEARGHGSATLGPWTPDAAPATTSCTLERRPGVRGRVTANGEGVPNARVALHEIAARGTRIEMNGFGTRLHPEAEDRTTTDAEGFYELDPNRPGGAEGHRFFQADAKARRPFAVVCEADGWARAEIGPLDVDPAIGADDVDAALTRGGTIEGRVLVAAGRDPSGAIVGFDRGDARPRTVRVGPDGTFRVEHLTPGRWLVKRVDREFEPGHFATSWSSGDTRPATPATNCTVAEGAVTRFDVDLVDDRPCVLLASVSIDGAPAAGWIASLEAVEGGTGHASANGVVDANGALRLELRDPGDCTFELVPPSFAGSRAHYQLGVAMRRGENALSVVLDAGTIRGRCAAATEESMLMFEAPGADGKPSCHAGISVGTDGTFVLPLFRAGPVRITRLTPNGERVPEHLDVVVPARGEISVEVP